MIIVNKYIQIVSFFVLSAMFYEKNQKKIIECAITGHYCHCWKVLNHDITTFPATECDRSRQRAERSLLSNLDPRVWHLVTPKDMFSSSHWLSWWNICSVVNGVIVASHSCGLITVKFIDLCSSMTWFIFTVQQCECVSARVCKSGRHRWFYLFFPSYTSFFFTAQNSSSLSWQKFLESLLDTFCGAAVHRHSTITPTHLLSRAINWEKLKNATSHMEKNEGIHFCCRGGENV